MSAMSGSDLAAVLDYLELDDDRAALAFGVSADDVRAMKDDRLAAPFPVSLATVLMCESAKATLLALEHGLAMRGDELSLRDVLASATGVGVLIKPRRRPALRIVHPKP